MKRYATVLLLALLLPGIFSQCHKTESQTQVDLEKGFVNPPDEARPRV